MDVCVCSVHCGSVAACSEEAWRLCPLVELCSHLSHCAERPTHLHRLFMTPACKSVCERMAVCVCVYTASVRD